MAKEIYRSAPRDNRRPGRYRVVYWGPDGYKIRDKIRFKWVAILLAWMRREDYDVVVYDTKEEKA